MKLELASYKAIKYACLNFHYAKSVPVNTIGFSVFNSKNEWSGVVLYGTGANNNIANTYEYNNINIWHFDLYRIIDENELAIFDMPDILNNQIAIIEWANKFSSLIDYNPNTLIIEIIVKNKIREFNFYCKNEMILNNLKEKNR